MNFCEHRYLVTGAASGIGYQTVLTLIGYGAKVLMLDINESELIKISNELGDSVSYLTADLSLIDDNLKTAIESDVELNGKLNGFVHCAGLPYIAPVNSIKSDKAHKLYDVNTYAALELTKILTKKKIRADKDCASVLIASVYGLVGSAANAAYAMTKGAIVALTKALAIEYAPKHIRFNCVAPGFVKTAMLDRGSGSFDADYLNTLETLHPLGLGTAKDIAEPIAFLLSDKAQWITGSVLLVDGGFTAQ